MSMWATFTESVKKRVGRYLLQRYLGQYLLEKLTLDQLTVDLFHGTGTVTDILLDCNALNSAAEELSIPVEFKEGHLGQISVKVPWSAITTESCQIEVSDMQLTIQSKSRADNGASMWTSMASSMQLAEDCLKSVASDDGVKDFAYMDYDNRMTGLEHCAETIEAVMTRVKLCFRDTIVRIEQCQQNGEFGVAAEFHIKLWKYWDEEAGAENVSNVTNTNAKDQKKFSSPYREKTIVLEGIDCYCEIYKNQDTGRRNSDEKMSRSIDSMDMPDEDNLIRIARFNGSHTIKLKIKKDESIGGPQISTDCKLGSFVAFLSPIQAHALFKLLNELLNSDSIDEFSSKQMEKPMDTFDFKRVEEELQEQLRPNAIGITGLDHQGWSNLSSDESEDEFLPMAAPKSANVISSTHSALLTNSFMTGSSSMHQSTTESLASTAATQAYSEAGGSPRKSKDVTAPSQEEKTYFTVSFASTAIVLLHNDILTFVSVVDETESIQKARATSKNFFEKLGLFGTMVSGKKDVERTRDKLDAACSLNHLRLIGAPLRIEGTMYIADDLPLTIGHVSFGYCDLVEVLSATMNGPTLTHIPLLNFVDDFGQNSLEAVRIDFKHRGFKSRTPTTKTTLKINVAPSSSELDISMVNRISALLNPQLNFYGSKGDGPEGQKYPVSRSQSAVFMKILSSSFTVDFRFPIPDCRVETDANRIPPWVRNVRSDSVVLQAKDLTFSTVVNTRMNGMMELDFRSEEVELYYKEHPGDTPVLFGEARSYDSETEGGSMRTRGFDWPRVVVSIYPEKPEEATAAKDSPSDPDSLDSVITASGTQEPSVFSSKRIVHESLASDAEENSSNHESVIPGDRLEMLEFADTTSRNTVYKVDLNLRSVSLCLPSKYFFQELYNRFCNDILLWEPKIFQQFKKPPTPFKSFAPVGTVFNSRPGESESEDEEEISSFYLPKQPVSLPAKDKKKRDKGQSDVTVNLVINKGTCSFFTPFTNQGGSVVPEQRGQVTIDVQDLTLFVVSGFKGNRNLGFICLHTNKAEFHHSDFLSPDIDVPRFGRHMKRTIYRSELGVRTKTSTESVNCDNADMLALAIKIDREPEKNVKTFKVAVGIREATLEHRVLPPYRSWFHQAFDFFDVTDTLISGYTPSSVLTELHLHLWDCAIDYSPLNLPLRSILAVDTFSISSNIAALTNTKVIRFASEEASLYISPKNTSNELRKDFVRVMEMDFFELSFRKTQSRNNESPRMELKASNNLLHIRTCSDSCKALFNLIEYYANDGDLLDPDDTGNSSCDQKVGATYSPVRESVSEPALIGTEEFGERERRMSASQTEQVNVLVAEAMIDSDSQGEKKHKSSTTTTKSSKGTLELKFQPMEFQATNPNSTTKHYYEPIMQSMDGLPVEINISDDDEEEFCILENDTGVGILSKSGEPEARVLTTEPIRLVENYFTIPLGRTDILKAPKHYPMAINRYVVQDLSLIWHLYGGEDFGSSWSSRQGGGNKTASGSQTSLNISERAGSEVSLHMYEPSEQVDLGIDALNPGVVFSKTKAFENTWDSYDSPKSQRRLNPDNPTGCGKGRKTNICVELHLNKIKFQHEVYPETTEQASRQVLVIHNIEIRDRLQSSQFNKMLYLYTSPTRPRQSHAHMVIIKAAHVRPDPQLGIEECCLKISLLPIRLNIDQDALLFLYQFYQDMSPKGENEDDDSITKPPSHTPSLESLPVMMVNLNEGDEPMQGIDSNDQSNLLIFEDTSVPDDNVSICSKDPSIDSTKPPGPIYFRQVIFSPEVPIRLDYRGKRVDMTHGPLAGILMGLAQLNCLEIVLKKIIHRNGILGVDRLIAFLILELTNDIKKNQLPNLLGGVGPMYSFVQLFQGIRDLFWLPIEQYQKDGRIAKGLQRGANAFSTSAAMAALELTNRLVQTIQGAAEFTYDMVSPGPSVQQQRRQSSYKKKRYSQPGDIREGVSNAYHVVREGLGDTAKTIVRVASKEHEQKGVSGAVGGVLRQIPPTVVRPIILVAEATSNVLDGFRSQLEPEFKKDAEEKWKDNSS